MRKNKKADLSLSINAIVILILAITMLGLGLAFMRNIFGRATGEFNEVSGEVQKQMINQMKASDKIIDLSGAVYEIKQGEKKMAYIGFKNEDNAAKNFTIRGITGNSLSGQSTCGINDEDVMIEYKKTPTTVQPGATTVLPINIKTDSNAEKDSCFFEIFVDTGEEGSKSFVYSSDPSLIGYWSFDTNICTGTSCPTPTDDGKVGGAYEFIGHTLQNNYTNNRINESTGLGNVTFTGTNNLTVSTWVYPTDVPDIDGSVVLSNYKNTCPKPGCPPETDYGWLLGHAYAPGDYLGFSACNAAPCKSASNTTFFSNRNQWKHLTGVFTAGKSVCLYTDGKNSKCNKDNISNSITYPDENSYQLTIGARSDGTSGFTGKIDEVAIFKRALSEDEIAGLPYAYYDSSIQFTVNVAP